MVISHGYGRVGKHRKHPGGRGKAGGLKHLKTLFERYHPDHFGKVGIKIFHRNKNAEFSPAINVDKLWSLIPEDVLPEFVGNESVKAPVLDLKRFGYFEVLGRGDLFYKKPIVVLARRFTKQAEEKIVAAGGKCVVSG
ncbi:ribosomal protein L27a [Hamiltosporidium tvaerminnensis]|uniref:Ribosomal protein L27a n=2 Tax=Hamiltosporidium TaxID=1176354 RepID=A0A4Q9LDL4_9MICR|nr:ribosomal protein L27a [Hamiltosporidium magnivora]TBU20188.1 ribosomal protein L27a [Hamiltosporidium tvaerminnensis]